MMELHPAIVHFPIALLTTAAFFAVISLFTKKDFFKEVTFWNLLLGVIGAIAAVLTGLIEEQTMVHNEAIHRLLEKHEFNGIAILILSFMLLTWVWVRKNKFGKTEYKLWVSLLVLSTTMIFYQGYLGHKMVFEQGAGVKPMKVHMGQGEDSATTHIHSNSAHDHGNDSSASKKAIPGKVHSNPAHAHQVRQDTVKKKDSSQTKETKKELKGMKY